MNSVAVIGGGITGLTAAYRLANAGADVKLFEAAPRVGGVIQSQWRDGRLVEAGPNTIMETSPLVGDLIESLGLGPHRVYSDPAAERRYLVRGGKLVAMPGGPLGMAVTGLFSPAAKIRLLAEPFIAPAPADEEESIAQFVRRRLGQEFLDYAINPLVAGIYAGDPEKLSVRHGFPKLHALEQKYRSLILGQVLGARDRKRRGEASKQDAKKLSFDNGLQTLIVALREALGGRIHTSAPVSHISEHGSGWHLAVHERSSGHRQHFNSVLVALPAHRLAQLHVSAPSAFELPRFAAIPYPPVATVVLGFLRKDVGHPLDGFGVLAPEKEGLQILGALFSSTLFPNRCPKGEVLITCFVGGSRAPELTKKSHDEIASLAARNLSALLHIQGAPTFRHVSVFEHAIPQYNVGFGQFKAQMDGIEKAAPGLFFAGQSRDGTSVADCIVSGENAARNILSYFAAGPTARRQLLVAA